MIRRAEEWSEHLRFQIADGVCEETKGHVIASYDASIISEATIIVVALPRFAIKQGLAKIEPFLHSGQTLVFVPTPAGMEQIVEKYAKEYVVACAKIALERKRFIKELRKFNFLEVFQSEANYVLCEVKKPYTARSLTVALWKHANCLIKDCSGKKGFNKGQFVRIAVKSKYDDNQLLSTLQKLDVR